jgi:hypothetical protein
MLKPGTGKTHRAYLWSYATTQYDPLQAVVYDFTETRGGRHAEAFLGAWRGQLVCDDYAGYKALVGKGVTEVGCMAHARRKFHDLWANHQSQIAEEALVLFGRLYDVERPLRDLAAEARQQIRHLQARPIVDALQQWLILHRQKVPTHCHRQGDRLQPASMAGAAALPRRRHLADRQHWVENRIRPVALAANWLFAGSLRAGQRAAAVMSLIQSAKLNGHDPYRYLKDVLARLPTQPNRRIDELLPHRWTAVAVNA